MQPRPFTISAALLMLGVSSSSMAQQAPYARVSYHLDAAIPVLGTTTLFLLGILLCVAGAAWLYKNPKSAVGKLAVSAVGIGLLSAGISGGWLVQNARAIIDTTTYMLSANPSPAMLDSFPAVLENDFNRTAYITDIEVFNCGVVANLSGSCQAGSELHAGSSCTIDTICANGVTVTVEGVNGDINIPTSCVAGDYSCQAQSICESITGETCVYQAYDCAYGNQGSWYPASGNGGSDFNFAYAYDFYDVNYGNICACDTSKMDLYGLAQNHRYCGVGHWTRVASD